MTCSLIVIRLSQWLPSSTQHLDNIVTTQMAIQTQEQYTTIELTAPNGSEFRRVSTASARPPQDGEIPLIDLTSLDGNLEARRRINADAVCEIVPACIGARNSAKSQPIFHGEWRRQRFALASKAP
jgi:hypothetical protein